MSELTFENLAEQLMLLGQKGAYAESLELLQRESGRFPDREQATYYWRMRLAVRINNLALALQFFRELLEHGYSLPPHWLREDENLKPLQGLPEYEDLVAVCQLKFAELQANAKPEMLIMHPDGGVSTSSQPRSLLLALHGNAGNLSGTLGPWRGVVDQGWLLVLPQSSQAIDENAFVWDDWDKAAAEIQEHYVSLTHRYAIGERVIVGGFSMGGGLAIWLTLSRIIRAHGFVVLAPYVPDIEKLEPLLERARADGVHGYIIVGERDNGCLEIAHKLNALLNVNGIPCQLELRPGLGHTYPPDFDQSLEKALAFVTP